MKCVVESEINGVRGNNRRNAIYKKLTQVTKE